MSIEALKEQARRHEQKEDWRKALDLYLKAIRRLEQKEQPDISLHNRVGDLYTRIGESKNALSHYEAAVDLYMEAELANNAIAICKKVIRNLPNRHEIHLKMGEIRAHQGFLTDARQSFVTYAELMQAEGNIDDALDALIRFMDLAPEDIEMRTALAAQLEQHGRTEEAVEQLIATHQRMVLAGRDDEAAGIEAKIHELDPGAEIPPPPPGGFETPEEGEEFDFATSLTSFGDEEGGDEAAAAAAGGAEMEADLGEITLGDDEEEEAVAVGADTEVGGDLGEIALGFDDEEEEAEFAGEEEEEVEELPLMDFGDEEEEEAEEEEAEELPLMDFGEEEEAAEEVPVAAGEELELDEISLGEGEDEDEDEDEAAPAVEEAASEAMEEAMEEVAFEEEPAAAEEEPAAIEEEPAAAEAPGAAGGPDALKALGQELLEEGDAEQGTKLLRQALDGYASDDDLQGAYDTLQTLTDAHPDEVEYHQRLVEYAFRTNDETKLTPAYLNLASCLQRNGQEEKAQAVYQQVLVSDPDNEVAKAALGQTAEAPAESEAAAASEPAQVASSEDYVDLGSMILDEEEEEKSTRWKVAYEEPSGDEAADFAKMLSQFKEKVSENVAADDIKAHYDLGTAYKEMGLIDEAIGEFQAALRASAAHLPTYEMLGQCFIEQGQHDAAVRTLSKGLEQPYEVEDELIGIYYYLGRAHEELGNSDSAREFYDKIFTLDINFQDVTERLRSLREA